MANGVLDYAAFVSVIEELTDDAVKPVDPQVSLEGVRHLIDRHPLISPIEVREAFDLKDQDAVRHLIQPLLNDAYINIEQVFHGWFIRRL